MSLEELIKIIQESKFQNLLDRHHFTFGYKEHESRGGQRDGYSIGFESDDCKLVFYCEATISVAVVPRSSNWESSDWIDIESLMAYLLKQPVSRPSKAKDNLNKYLPYREKLKNKLSEIAENFDPLFDQIVIMFRNEENVAEWKPALEQYVRDDARRRYGEN